MNVEDELWDLALNTPSKYYRMHVTDTVSGASFVTDQTLDSKVNLGTERMKALINLFNDALAAFKDKTYEEVFEDAVITEVKLDEFLFRFEGIEGEPAFNFMKLYFKRFIDSLLKNGAIQWEVKNEQKE
jgi:hypothetical protein